MFHFSYKSESAELRPGYAIHLISKTRRRLVFSNFLSCSQISVLFYGSIIHGFGFFIVNFTQKTTPKFLNHGSHIELRGPRFKIRVFFRTPYMNNIRFELQIFLHSFRIHFKSPPSHEGPAGLNLAMQSRTSWLKLRLKTQSWMIRTVI